MNELKELKEITEPQIFDPPKKMLVWNGEHLIGERTVLAILSKATAKYEENVICISPVDEKTLVTYKHCAEIPEPRRATNRELAKWLMQSNGEVLTLKQTTNGLYREIITVDWPYFSGDDNEAVEYGFERQRCKGIRKWEDTEWHEPTADYMGLEA